MPLSSRTEIDPWCDGNSRLFQYIKRKAIGVTIEMSGIDENVKGALGIDRHRQTDLPETIEEESAAAVISADHLLNLFSRKGQGSDSGPLDKCGSGD